MDLLQEFRDTVEDYRTTSLLFVSATVLLSYEIFLTLGEEFKSIWLSSWSPITILHVLVRYYALCYMMINSYASISAHLTGTFCSRFYPFEIWGAAIIVPVADIILLLRIYSLYSANKKIGALLVVLWIVESAVCFRFQRFGRLTDQKQTVFGLIASGFEGTAQDPNPLSGVLPGCFAHNPFRSVIVLNSGAIVIPVQGQQLVSRDSEQWVYRQGWGIILPCHSHYYQSNSPLESAGQGWEVAIVAITAGMMVLNLRSSVRNPSDEWTTDTYILSGDDIEGGQFTSLILVDIDQ
ncbi:hypothetical protein M422DRAFT_53643 [Sphaerobolus stellatus SS14]|uniref:DUF6533 domain-containing protein n=1 Tax=Sphaerobolus stellatus (strain SS14) TaxID=990650 RepID=A0A0C9UZY1_SPHS4|nr:hypothetical protein M422DRAFT_53643 [Sphaerobolus stellatus SS14]